MLSNDEKNWQSWRFTRGWYILWCVLGLVMAIGLYAYFCQLYEGEVVTGMRDMGTMRGVPWGLYIVFVVYFIGISFAGITIAVLVRLLNLRELRPIARMAELLTIISLILGALSILADVGQPLRAFFNLFRYARPQSPFFGTFSLVVSGYLLASLVYFYLEGRRDAAILAQGNRLTWFYRLWAAGYQNTDAQIARHSRSSFWLAIAIFPLLVTAHSTLGFVFGLQVGRPGWFSTIQAPAFVILAGVSGVGMLIIIAALIRWFSGETEKLNEDVFKRMSNFLLLFTMVYLYFMVVEWLSTIYTGHHHEREVMHAILFGEYAWIYWGSIVCLVVPAIVLFGQWLLDRYNLSLGRYNLGLIVASGIMVNLAAIGKRYILVIPSQTHGTLLPYGTGSYSPSWVELAIIAGLFALGIFFYTLFMKIFPIMELAEPETEEKKLHISWQGVSRRALIAIIMVVVGFALQAISYLYLAAPIGIPTGPEFSDPRVPFAAFFFIIGVVIVFLAAVVYELMPDREEKLSNV